MKVGAQKNSGFNLMKRFSYLEGQIPMKNVKFRLQEELALIPFDL